MKLNKPPVSEEQSVLEEYVDFLLTDKSNVTPLPAKNGADLKPERIVDSNDDEPKWTTIEKATKGFETAEHKIARIKKELDEVVHQDDEQTSTEASTEAKDEAPESNKVHEEFESAQNELEPDKVKETSESKLQETKQKSAKQEVASQHKAETTEVTETTEAKEVTELKNDDFSLQAEEEEAKAWDQVLTKEKEQALLKSLESDENAAAAGIPTSEESKAQARVESIHDDKLDKAQVKPESVSSTQKPKIEIPSEQSKEATSIQNKTQELIDEYLPHREKDERLAGVEKLLARISLATQPKVQTQTETKVQQSESVAAENEISQKAAEASFIHREADKLKDILPEVFQTLIFKVGKMPLAVPLLKLGGIVKVSSEDITPLVGTPDWFVGLVPNDRGNLMVVDTQNYLMPEQPSKSVEEMNYEYLILLDDSNWALACNSVGDAKNLVQDDIRWSERSSRRPWFAGMVVEYMSALIEVDELINMLADTITKK